MAELPNTYAKRPTPTFGGRTMVAAPVDTGEAALGASISGFGQALIKEEILNARDEATDKINQLEARIIDNRTNEESGWENRLAHGLGKDFIKEETDRLNQSIDDFASEITDPYAKEVFSRRADVIRNRVAGNLAGHATKEKKVARHLTYEGSVQMEIEKSAINYDNDDEINASILNINKNTSDYLESIGVTGDKRKEIMQQNVSALHRAVIVAAIKDDRYGVAQDHMDGLEEDALTLEDANHVKDLLQKAGIKTASQDLEGKARELFPDDRAKRRKYIGDNSSSFLEEEALARETRETAALAQVTQKGKSKESQALVRKAYELFPEKDQQLERRDWLKNNSEGDVLDSSLAREKEESATREAVTKKGAKERSQDVVEQAFLLYPGTGQSTERQRYIMDELSGAVEDDALQRETFRNNALSAAEAENWKINNTAGLAGYVDGLEAGLKPEEAWDAIDPEVLNAMHPQAWLNLRKRMVIETEGKKVTTEFSAWFELFEMINGDAEQKDKFRDLDLDAYYSGRVSTDHLIFFAKLQKSDIDLKIASTISEIKAKAAIDVFGEKTAKEKKGEVYDLHQRIDREMIADQIRTGKDKAGAIEAQVAADRVTIEYIRERAVIPGMGTGDRPYNVTGDVKEYAGHSEIQGVPTDFIDELALSVQQSGAEQVTELAIKNTYRALAYAVHRKKEEVGDTSAVTENDIKRLYYHLGGDTSSVNKLLESWDASQDALKAKRVPTEGMEAWAREHGGPYK